MKPSRKVFRPSRKVAKAWDEAGNWDECVDAVAFHEAGHAVAHAFLGVGFRGATIITHAEDKMLGRVTGQPMDSPWIFKDMVGDPSAMAALARGHRSKMLFLHAGPAAESKYSYPGDAAWAPGLIMAREAIRRRASVAAIMEDVWMEPPEGTDAEKLLQFAWLIRQQEPQHSMEGILQETARWTNEMLAIPEVWNAVEQVARLLLKHGTLEGDDGCPVHDAVKPIRGLALRHPAWVDRIRVRVPKAQP